MSLRRETSADDDRRTRDLLDRADHAFGREEGGAFEDVVMEGLMTDKASANYPPSGHGYPRRG
ncbi:MAG: hypothetical protein HOW59_29600 [Nonomuraea sp.]|nr:hypothetical protein [Nonomuraea sp.]NUS89405.1 hypothetical protein [Streptomyces sp.]